MLVELPTVRLEPGVMFSSQRVTSFSGGVGVRAFRGALQTAGTSTGGILAVDTSTAGVVTIHLSA